MLKVWNKNTEQKYGTKIKNTIWNKNTEQNLEQKFGKKNTGQKLRTQFGTKIIFLFQPTQLNAN